MSELKPCPFCGGSKAYIICNIELEPDGITCPTCHIVMRFPRIRVKGNEKFGVAIGKMTDVWNRRAGEQDG